MLSLILVEEAEILEMHFKTWRNKLKLNMTRFLQRWVRQWTVRKIHFNLMHLLYEKAKSKIHTNVDVSQCILCFYQIQVFSTPISAWQSSRPVSRPQPEPKSSGLLSPSHTRQATQCGPPDRSQTPMLLDKDGRQMCSRGPWLKYVDQMTSPFWLFRLQTRGHGRGRRRGRGGGGRGLEQSDVCFICGRLGHWADDCMTA